MNMKSKILTSLIWKFSEQIMVKAFSLIISIILARILIPDDYGVIAIVIAVITICGLPVTNGFNNGLIQKKDADDIDYSTAFYINIVVAVIIYIFIFFLAPIIAIFYNMPQLKVIIRVLGVSILLSGINSIQHAFVAKHMMFKLFFYSTLIGTLISGAAGVVMALRGFGIWALAVQILVNTFIDTMVLWFTVGWRPKLLFSWDRAIILIRYSWKLVASGFLNSFSGQLGIYIIGKWYSAAELAYYNQGDKYPGILMTSIDTAINSVLFPALSDIQDNIDKVKSLSKAAVKVSTFIIFPVMLGACACAEPAIRVIFTEKWLPCLPFFRVFCLVYAIWPIHTINLQVIKALGKSEVFLKLDIVKQLIATLLILLCVRIDPLMVAYGILVADVISIIINIYPNIRLIDYGLREQLSDMAGSAAISLVMAIVVYLLGLLDIGDVHMLLIQVITGALMYMTLSYIFNRSVLEGMLDFIKGHKR